MEDSVSNLLRKVARGEVSVEDAREALEGVELTEQEIESVIEHGVHNRAELGTIVSASLAPSGGSYLIMLFFVWGNFLHTNVGIFIHLRTCNGLGSTTTVIPPCNDHCNTHFHGNNLPEVCPA